MKTKTKRILPTTLAAIAVLLGTSAYAAEGDASAPAGTGLSKSEAKDLKTESKAEYKARKKVAEANEVLDKADCNTGVEGMSARHACRKSATAAARSAKADAKTLHKVEQKAITDSTK